MQHFNGRRRVRIDDHGTASLQRAFGIIEIDRYTRAMQLDEFVVLLPKLRVTENGFGRINGVEFGFVFQPFQARFLKQFLQFF